MHFGGAVAQLGERLVRNEEVRGSIPLGSTSPDMQIPLFFQIDRLENSRGDILDRFQIGSLLPDLRAANPLAALRIFGCMTLTKPMPLPTRHCQILVRARAANRARTARVMHK